MGKTKDPRAVVIAECREYQDKILKKIEAVCTENMRLATTGHGWVIPGDHHRPIYDLSAQCIELLFAVRPKAPRTLQELEDQAAIDELLRVFRCLRTIESRTVDRRLHKRAELLGRSPSADEIRAMLREN
ncbi:MAG TPA: hypothetical protein VLM91_02095 [Candidatus Methylomirabilis sp.]|nr:hypothetical protein [Candidatus Methylomirabilis sp.]